MRLLLLNANTTAALTDRMVAAARLAVPAGVEVAGATAPFGEPYISTRAASAVAAHAVVEVVRARPAADAIVIACFGDPGLDAARAIAEVPVVGMAEASCHTACQLGRRFSIVTGGRAWQPMLTEFVAHLGLSSRLASVRALTITGAEIAGDPDAAIELIAREGRLAVDEDGADVVILGGAALVGLKPRIEAHMAVPVLDSLACVVAQAVALARLSWHQCENAAGM